MSVDEEGPEVPADLWQGSLNKDYTNMTTRRTKTKTSITRHCTYFYRRLRDRNQIPINSEGKAGRGGAAEVASVGFCATARAGHLRQVILSYNKERPL